MDLRLKGGTSWYAATLLTNVTTLLTDVATSSQLQLKDLLVCRRIAL